MLTSWYLENAGCDGVVGSIVHMAASVEHHLGIFLMVIFRITNLLKVCWKEGHRMTQSIGAHRPRPVEQFVNQLRSWLLSSLSGKRMDVNRKVVSFLPMMVNCSIIGSGHRKIWWILFTLLNDRALAGNGTELYCSDMVGRVKFDSTIEWRIHWFSSSCCWSVFPRN